MREALRLFSPAKVNLFFRVLCKRADGYHDIASLYHAISLGDVVTVSLSDADHITCDDPLIPCDEKNLTSKALHVFRKMTGFAQKVHIHLEKRIPMEAGLGGGSSNAATVLFALNQLSSFRVEDALLSEWASTFSSDAPFFFSHGAAYCEGRGEKLTCLPAQAPVSFWIAKPSTGLSTPRVYGACKPDSFPQRDPQEYLQRALRGDLETFNDLEHPAFSLMPSLEELKISLQALGFERVTMTGSGTAFMCFGREPASFVLPAVRFFPVHFIQRTPQQWYEFPSV
jgi:4-diphosphocytidyl-2-C-methyl-D-erythritol kinase